MFLSFLKFIDIRGADNELVILKCVISTNESIVRYFSRISTSASQFISSRIVKIGWNPGANLTPMGLGRAIKRRIFFGWFRN